MNELVIIRGLPGSGKSTLGKKFVALGFVAVEADSYFINSGQYVFNPSLLKDAHQWCYEAVRSALRDNPVVVCNTFSRIWEMQKYLDLPNPKTVIECQGMFGNIHGVPMEAILRMRNRWEVYPQ